MLRNSCRTHVLLWARNCSFYFHYATLSELADFRETLHNYTEDMRFQFLSLEIVSPFCLMLTFLSESQNLFDVVTWHFHDLLMGPLQKHSNSPSFYLWEHTFLGRWTAIQQQSQRYALVLHSYYQMEEYWVIKQHDKCDVTFTVPN